MRTEVLAPVPDALARAVELLRAGEVVAFPTDTVYGVGAAASEAGIERLYEVKDRPPALALPVLIHDLAQLDEVAVASDEARRLCARFWPGPLTVVLPRRPHLPARLTGGRPTVGVRLPDHPVALALLRAAGAPLAVTSANVSGQPPATDTGEVLRQLDGRLPLVLDGGRSPGGRASTVLDLSGPEAAILRAGPLDAEVLAQALGRPVRSAPEKEKAVKIAVGSDYAGFDLKEYVVGWLKDWGHEFKDFGAYDTQVDDYPDRAFVVARAVAAGEFDFGILVCGTGQGMAMAANKVRGIRAAVCTDTFMAHTSREHNQANILCMGARVLGRGAAEDITRVWLTSDASPEERHCRRVGKINAFDQGRERG